MRGRGGRWLVGGGLMGEVSEQVTAFVNSS
jgi:hypothetical protein